MHEDLTVELVAHPMFTHGATSLSAALTGRTARGITNRLMRVLSTVAPLPPYRCCTP